MNRLILIGNGFDLAHGLKTSYHDFILDYLKECFEEALNNMPRIGTFYYSDDLLQINLYNKNNFPIELISDLKNNAKNIKEILSKTINILVFSYKGNGFAQSLLDECFNKNWVDIESLYYADLKRFYREYVKFKNGENDDFQAIDRLKNLNVQLDFIKGKLEIYLTTVYSKNVPSTRGLKDIIHNNLEPFVDEEYIVKIPGEFLFLNFNYTSTPDIYKDEDDEIINIHGELKEDKNPVIFGYGDEVDKFYEQIEDLNENEFFKHIKSFDYFKTSNYTKLLGFLEKGEFEVFVMGHSCGLSDRTMLSTIFEHQNCSQIKIFDYREDKNNYRDKTYEISRHFKDKASMRKKIVPFDKDTFMPQAPKLQ